MEHIQEFWTIAHSVIDWMRSHDILLGISFLDLLVYGIVLDVLYFAITELLPGFLGREKEDDGEASATISGRGSRFEMDDY